MLEGTFKTPLADSFVFNRFICFAVDEKVNWLQEQMAQMERDGLKWNKISMR